MARAGLAVVGLLVGLTACSPLDDDGVVTTRSLAAGAGAEVGALEPGDATLDSGEWYDRYEFEAAVGQWVDIRLDSEDFDTYLVLVGPHDYLENDDDDRGDSSIRTQLASAGTYQVLVTSYEPGEAGEYRLQIDLGEVEPLPEVGTLELGSKVEGVLGEAGDRQWEGQPVDVYQFEGEAGTAVRLTLESSELDTYLVLYFPDGAFLSNDDDWDREERSRIEVTLPRTGVYQVWASAYWAEQTGAYSLSLQRTRASAPLRGAPSRTFALLSGISDYPGEHNDLPGSADDARNLQRVLVERAGMAPADSLLLVDSAATVGGFRSAVGDLVARMGPTDQLLVFYSGHGSRVRRDTYQAADPDAVDETLSLYDGQLTDDEMSDLLADVPGRVLLIVDACFAGGFAKDVISRPGRMGIFSSEEDVTSAIADKFQAGGYLAVFLIRALAGDWADDGDGRLTTLELSHFLHESYRTGVKGSGADEFVPAAEGPLLGYQRLVVDRGSLSPTDILFDLRSGDG